MSDYLTVEDSRTQIKQVLALLNAGGVDAPFIVMPAWTAIKSLAPFIVVEQRDQFVDEFEEAVAKHELQQHWTGSRDELPVSQEDESELQLFLDEVEQDIVIAGVLDSLDSRSLAALMKSRDQAKDDLRNRYGIGF